MYDNIMQERQSGNVYINDLPNMVFSSIARLFADNCLLYSNMQTVRDTKLLLTDLDNLQVWESEWLTEFNPTKCEAITFSKKTKPVVVNYTMHRITLTKISSNKHLGVNISHKLSWNSHVDNVTKRTTQILNFVRRNFSGCPRPIREHCYISLIRPQLEYITPHFGTTASRSISGRQNRSAYMVNLCICRV